MNIVSLKKLLTLLLLVTAFFAVGKSYAAGLMQPSNANYQSLDIQEHHVDVTIADGYAVTQVEQIFYNPNAQDLEAIYSFPVPAKAAVSEFTYWIDEVPIVGEVLAKQKARDIYQSEKAAGREAGLTEQNSYKTFDIKVFPVRAGQNVKIRLSYIQAAHVDSGIGRYVYPLEEGGTDEERLAFWTHNSKFTEKFSFNLRFRSSYPVEQFRLPKHPQAVISQISDKEWQVSLTNDAAIVAEGQSQTQVTSHTVFNLDQDVLLYWRHSVNKPASVDLLSYKKDSQSKGTFMLTITPGDDLEPVYNGGDYVFVLDFSGSMQGKYASLVEGVKKGVEKLSPRDRFRIIIFKDDAIELTRGYAQATAENVQTYLNKLETQQPDGSTNLYEGLYKAMKGVESDRSSSIILVTDGVANVGKTHKKAFLTLLEKHDVRLFTFVMGNNANRPLLQGMTKVSNGFSANISNSDDIAGKLLEATAKMTHKAMHDVKINISGIKVRNLTPENIGSLYRGQQLIVLGHYWGHGQAKVEVSGKIAGQKKVYTTEIEFTDEATPYPEIERLWAYAKIADLQEKMDYFGHDKDTEQAITDIAIQAGLVTNYTSMLVVRDEVFEQYGIQKNNAERVKLEKLAQQQRLNAAVQSHRADRAQPMYSSPAANHSGGGSINIWVLLFLPLVCLFRLNNRAGELYK
ncbi:VIT and vWA domain-containing protein [Catenovulum sediminis]|uniref:VIT and VWA domain-containing protein n=1 Tax=Catenovulum sediminis TaxID=1740262 RepID=A0ABV1RF05_9ALTE|nr:VIT and VWA domain-containing protein [Catenovulum sediminis]